VAADALRPDGVLCVRRPDGREERLAVEADTTQHGARRLTRTCAAYREALALGVYDGVVWSCAPGAGLATAGRAFAECGDGRRMRAAPSPRAPRSTDRGRDRGWLPRSGRPEFDRIAGAAVAPR
jgi:hypothetical protein